MGNNQIQLQQYADRKYNDIYLPYHRSNGISFTIPVSNVDPELLDRIKEGSIVSFEFENYSQSEMPVKPKITKIRNEIKWEDVLLESRGDKPGWLLVP